MKKFILFIVLSVFAYSAEAQMPPADYPDGLDAKFIGNYSYTQAEIDAMVIPPGITRTVWNVTTGEKQWYNGSIWVCLSCGDPGVTMEGYTEQGTRAGGDLIVTIGDFDDSNNGTRLEIDQQGERFDFNGSIETRGFTIINPNNSYAAIFDLSDISNQGFNRTFKMPDESGGFSVFAGNYDASTGLPNLTNADTGKDGVYYYVSGSGSQDFGAGSMSLSVGDIVENNGSIWYKKGSSGGGSVSAPNQEVTYGNATSDGITSSNQFVYNEALNSLTFKNGFFGSTISNNAFRMTESNGNFVEMAYLNGDPVHKFYKSGLGIILSAPTITANREISLQDGDGTLAFLSDVNGATLPNNEIGIGTGSGITSNSELTYDGSELLMSGDGLRLFTTDAAEFGSSLYIKKTESATGTKVTEGRRYIRNGGVGEYFGSLMLLDDTNTTNAEGTTGEFIQVDKEGTGDLNYMYGQDINVRHKDIGNINFLTGSVFRSKIEGSLASTAVNQRAISTNAIINNINASVDYLQGYHDTVQIQSGTVGEATVLYLDFDAGSQGVVTGDLSYIQANDEGGALDLLTVSGLKRFVNYSGELRSDFGGVIYSNSTITEHENAGDKVLMSREANDARYIQSVTGGTNVTVDNTDPNNPIINATSGGSSSNLIAYKTANETITSDNTLTADSDLTVSLEANSKYSYEIIIYYTSASTPDFKSSLTTPVNSTGFRMDMMNNANGYTQPFSFVYVENGLGTNQIAGAKSNGYIETVDAGDISVNWAQNTSDTGLTTLRRGSYIKLTKLN